MRIAHFDLFSGASGDMILGALVDAGLDPADLRRDLRKYPLKGYSLEVARVRRGAIAATKVDVEVQGPKSKVQGPKSGRSAVHGPDHDHAQEHWHGHSHHPARGVDHDHETEVWHGHHAQSSTVNRQPSTASGHGHGTTLKTILGQIAASGLNPRVKANAAAVFNRLGKAEGKVHGIPPLKVHFHEVGAVDSIVDIVGACAGLDRMGIDAVTCTPFPVTRGSVDCRHGTIPVPGPATAELLRGFPVTALEIERELVTPTGAAILTTLASRVGGFPDLTLERTGYGAGTADPPDRPNVLRVWIGETVEGQSAEPVWVLETNVDDLAGNVAAYLIERLLAAGALDAWAVPIQMKKGRPGLQLGAIAPEGKVASLQEILFREGTTFGIRRHRVERSALARETVVVPTPHGKVRVKVGRLGGDVTTAAPEFEDCRRIAEAKGIPLKRVLKMVSGIYRRLHDRS